MCTAIPRELQGRDTRYFPPRSQCDCGAELVEPRSKLRGYCEQCHVATIEVNEADAIATVRRVFPDARVIDGYRR